MILRTRPHLVLLDVNMPGLSGTALTRVIREKQWSEELRFLFYSSIDVAELETLVEEAGADGYILKGSRARLQEQVAQALGG